jgi:hypothetical protein
MNFKHFYKQRNVNNQRTKIFLCSFIFSLFILLTMKYKRVDGMVVVNGKKYQKRFGSRAEVWHETAFETTGLLRKKDLMMNKHGRIVSKEKHATAKKEKRLLEYGWGFKKGEFGPVKLSSKKMTKKVKHHKGGSFSSGLDLSGNYPDAVGVKSSTEPGTVFPTTLGGGFSLNGAPFPNSVGKISNPDGPGMSQQDLFLNPSDENPETLALTKGGRKHKLTKHKRTRRKQRRH